MEQYAEDTWVSVFTGDNFHHTKYAIAEDADEFREKFEQRTEQGYELIDYEQVDGALMGIYEKPDSATSELSEGLTDLAVFNSLLNIPASISI